MHGAPRAFAAARSVEPENATREAVTGLATEAGEPVATAESTTGEVAAPVSGSPETVGADLSIDEAFALALRVHPLVRAGQANVEAARSDTSAAKWQRAPSLSWTNQQLNSSDDGEQADNIFNVSQPLWAGGRITAGIDAAKAREQVAGAAKAESELALLDLVAQTFSEAVRLGRRGEVAAANVAEHERLAAQIGRRVARRVSSKTDAALATARLRQATTERLVIDSARQTALANLRRLVGRPVGQLSSPPLEQVPLESLDQALDDAIAYSPALRRLAAERDAVDSEADITKAQNFPTISARYEKTTGGRFADDRLLLALEYQSGAGLSALSGYRAATRRVEAATASTAAARLDVEIDVNGRYYEAASLLAQLLPAGEFASANASVKASYQRQYAAGRKTWLEVLNAQRELAQAQGALVDVEVGAWLARKRLALLTGDASVLAQ